MRHFTQMRICATDKLPIAAARCSDVLRSRSLTVELTSLALLCNNVVTMLRISDLWNSKQIYF